MLHHQQQHVAAASSGSSRRLDVSSKLGASTRRSGAHARPGRCRSQTVCAFGSQPERIANVRTGALSLEADAPVVAASSAHNSAAHGSSRRRIRRVDSSPPGSSTSSSSLSSSSTSSSSILAQLSRMQPPAHTASTTAVAASSDASPPAAAAAAEASAAETADLLSTHAAAPAAANGAAPSPAAAPAAAGPQQASADSSNHSSPPAAASPSAVVDASAQSTDDEDSEYSKQLQDEIQQASCCQDILDIVADEASHFQSYHTVAALARLAKLGRGLAREQRFEVLADPGFIALLGRLSQQAVAGVLTPFELSNAFYSCGVLQLPLETLKTRTADGSQGPPALDTLESAITLQTAQFNDRDVSSTLYGYAQLRQRRPQSLAVISALVSRAQSLVGRGACSPRCTSMILWALATLFGGNNNSSSSKDMPVNIFVAAAARQLASEDVDFDALGSQGVANSLWGAVKLGCRHEELLGKATEWLAANAGRCKMQEVLNILWAAGACRHRPLQLGSIVAHVAQHAESLKPADMASLFHVLGIFGFDFSSKQELLQQLLPRAQALLPSMKPFEVTSLYWGLGMTRQVDNPLFASITGIVAQLQQQQLKAQARLQQQQQGVDDGDDSSDQQQQQGQGQGQLEPQQLAALQAKSRQLSESLQRQAFQAYIAARLEGAAVELPSDVLDALRSAWLAGNNRSRGSRGPGGSKRQFVDPLLSEFDWFMGEMRVKGQVATRSKLDKLIAVDVAFVASGQRLVALQLLPDNELDSMGSKLAAVQWEEDVLRRNGYDEVYWLHVSDYKRVPKASRPRYVADLLRKLGVNPQERLVAAAEKAWVAAGCKPPAGGSSGSSGGGSGSGSSWGGRRVAEGDISAAEADVLMQDGGGGSSAGGWASGGRGTRSRRNFTKRR